MLILDHFWCSLVTSLTFSSNLSNFEKNSKHPKKLNFFQTILFKKKKGQKIKIKLREEKNETNPKIKRENFL